MSEGAETKFGVWAAARRGLDVVLATAQNRLELFSIELQEERCRLIEILLCATAVAALGMMTLSLLTFTVVVVFWENGRLPALGGLGILYLVGTGLAWRALQRRLTGKHVFAETLDELKKDRACLDPDH